MKKRTLPGGGVFGFPPLGFPVPNMEFTKRQQAILTIVHAMIASGGWDGDEIDDIDRRNLISRACKLADELLNSNFF